MLVLQILVVNMLNTSSDEGATQQGSLALQLHLDLYMAMSIH
jgi:hypothetical protein